MSSYSFAVTVDTTNPAVADEIRRIVENTLGTPPHITVSDVRKRNDIALQFDTEAAVESLRVARRIAEGMPIMLDPTVIQAARAAIAEAKGIVPRRPRRPTSDDRLREVAQLHAEHYRPGRHSDFAQVLGVSERQMWRLVKLARERGFLPK